MISQQDTTNATEQSSNGSDSSLQGVDLRFSLGQLTAIQGSSESREQLCSEVAGVLNASPVVFEVFYLEFNGSELDFRLLRTGGVEVAKNIEQWAANVGIACCTTGETRLEQSQDSASSSSFQMIGVPVTGNATQSALIAMLHGDDDQANKLTLIESAARCLSQWQSTQQLTLVTEAAEDLAAQAQLVASVEAAQSLASACHVVVKSLSRHVEGLNAAITDTVAKATPTTSPATSPAASLTASHTNATVDVYVGLTQGNRPLKLTAASNANSLPASEQLAAIEAAMQECLCRNSISHWPRRDDDPAGLLCLKRMSKVVGVPNLVACPIPCSDLSAGSIGVIVFASHRPLSARSVAFTDSCSARLGSAMRLVERSEPGKFQGLLDKVADLKKNRKTLALVCFLGLVTCLIPMPYHVSSECEVRPESKLYIASPFDTTLETCHIEPGQQVSKDTLLATLDGRETRLELAELEAELNRAIKQRDGHVVSHESGEAHVVKYEIERLQSRRDLLLHRQESLNLFSPLAGIVIAGDLKKSEGMPLKVGETLFEVAPLDKLRVELAIPEDDVRYTQPDMETKIRLDAFPFQSWQGKIERIHPASELRNDQNVFVAIVQIDNTDGKLRPGMRGYASTTTIWRPVIWNYLHKPAAAAARWLGW